MEQKINYQYTYFIHPFIIEEKKYKEYIIKMLKDQNIRLKIFEKEKDFKMYKYFLPNIRELLFSSFSYGNRKLKQLEELPIETRAAILSNCQCNIFEYTLEKDIQAKVDDEKGIYFSIRKIDVICFKTGVCFLCIKTNLDDVEEISDVLNFNYKFKDINSKTSKLGNFDNIHIQTDSFSNMETFNEFLRKITGNNDEISKININTESFLTYSYVCIDQEAWNSTNEFDNVRNNFIKLASNLPADNSFNLEESSIEVFSKWKYAKIGLTKSSVCLLASSNDINNYTILPDEYEKQYFYTYIFNLYKRIYLKKLENELKNKKNIKKTRHKLIEFTKQAWIREITEDEIGTKFNNKMHEIFEIDYLYKEIEYKYEIISKEINSKKKMKIVVIAFLLFVVSIALNMYNYLMLINK